MDLLLTLPAKDLTSCISLDLFDREPTGGSTTSSLRQFRKKDIDKGNGEPQSQPQKPMSESHVARVAPHNHYPPANDAYHYPTSQFSGYSPQMKYSDLEAPQPNHISTSVIQKPKTKDYLEMCNIQQQHLSNQQYSPDNGQYLHKDPSQNGFPNLFKPESQYYPKDQHHFQQMPHHSMPPKFNQMINQNIRKYNPTPTDNAFLNKLSQLRPSIARSIMNDHHLQDTQAPYPVMDQRAMYSQQNSRYYPGAIHQPNPYSANPNCPITPTHPYPNYPPAGCNYTRPSQMAPVGPRYPHMERSASPTRRGYPESMHMPPVNAYHPLHQKMPSAPNYAQYPQHRGPEYAQHYQHRRMPQDCYPAQACRPRPAQFMQGHHQLSGQDLQDLAENTVSPSESLKKFIENWDDDDQATEMNNSLESGGIRDKLREDAPGTLYMINPNDVQYFENNGISIVTSENGSFQLSSDNYQYLNGTMVRIIETNKDVPAEASSTQDRVVNLQIMETSKPDCMMPNKLKEGTKVVIHQNTVLDNPLQKTSHGSNHQLNNSALDSMNITKELVDKNCSPINLEQLDHNMSYNPLGQSKAEDLGKANLNEDLSQNSDDSQYKSPGSKSMPLIDFFAEDTAVVDEEFVEPSERGSGVIVTPPATSLQFPDVSSLEENKCDPVISEENSEFSIESGENPPAERRRRIFSVDDIIGSSSKKDLNICSSEVVTQFLENEASFSSLEQLTSNTKFTKDEPDTLQTILKVSGPSALLQVAGELMEITVRIVDGKKVINVKTLGSDANTVVDCNHNYEVSCQGEDVNGSINEDRAGQFKEEAESFNDFCENATKKVVSMEGVKESGFAAAEAAADGNVAKYDHTIAVECLQEDDQISSPDGSEICEDEENAEEAENGLYEFSKSAKQEAFENINEDIEGESSVIDESYSTNQLIIEEGYKSKENETSLLSGSFQMEPENGEGDQSRLKDGSSEIASVEKQANSEGVLTKFENKSVEEAPVKRKLTLELRESVEAIKSENSPLMEVEEITKVSTVISLESIENITPIISASSHLSDAEVTSDVTNKVSTEPTSMDSACLTHFESEIIRESNKNYIAPETDASVEFVGEPEMITNSMTERHESNAHSESNNLEECSGISNIHGRETQDIKEDLNVSPTEDDNADEIECKIAVKELKAEDLKEAADDDKVLNANNHGEEETVISGNFSEDITGSVFEESIAQSANEIVPIDDIENSHSEETDNITEVHEELLTETSIITSDVDIEDNFLDSEDTPYQIIAEEDAVNVIISELPDPMEAIQEIHMEGELSQAIEASAFEDEEQEIFHTDYPLEDEVFIEEPPVHEVIVTNPLEDIGVIEEDHLFSNSSEIPLEPVTTSDIDIAQKKVHDEACSETTILEENIKAKVAKLEVQILSPTSTNIEEGSATANNVYINSYRKYDIYNDSSDLTSTSPIATKAAKKLYALDLQVQHDTVSSSKKEECPKNKKVNLKRSKRLNEKGQIKSEQKEMLKVLAERRNRRKELAQKSRLIDRKPEKVESKPEKVNKSQEEDKALEADEEYVDFKELLRARKLKKLRKQQEMEAKKEENCCKKEPTTADTVKKSENQEGSCCIGCSSSSFKKPKLIKEDKKPENPEPKYDTPTKAPQKRVSFSDDIPSSTSYGSTLPTPIDPKIVPPLHGMHPKDPRRQSKVFANHVMVPSVSELIEENGGPANKKKITLADYVSRKRKATSTDSDESKRPKSDSREQPMSEIVPKTISDVKTSFVLNSSDWEDSNSPAPTPHQAQEQCLIEDFSGLIKTQKPVIDVNELVPVDVRDKKLQEYKEHVDSQLNSLNIQIPKFKSRSPGNGSLMKRFLNSEKLSESEMDEIKRIIYYKKTMSKKNIRSPSKSPISSPTYEVRRGQKEQSDLRRHLRKVNAKRKTSEERDSGSVTTHQSDYSSFKTNCGYSVINRLGDDGQPKIIFKRNKFSGVAQQPVVELVKLDLDNLETVQRKYNVTVRQVM
ncbi:fap1 adhesin-like isoform X2 [Euwallacea similis]|uniref:fap1 adhesin-like isoform X2 n=1 Tax=Euwallacea similis TaxID=1736056 RepID=UPI00344D077D